MVSNLRSSSFGALDGGVGGRESLMVAIKISRPGPANKRNGLGNEMWDCNVRVRGHRGIFMIDVGMCRTGRHARICVLATNVGIICYLQR